MLEKDDSVNVSTMSDQSQSQNVINLLSEKLPEVEEILINAIKIIEEENIKSFNNDDKYESRIDLISAFNEILEIYELTKIVINSYMKKEHNVKKINDKIRELKYKYLDLQSNYHSIIEETNIKDEQLKANDELLRNVENENYELKIKIEDLNHVIKAQRKLSPVINNNKIKSSNTIEFKPNHMFIEYEEQIKYLKNENNELDSKCRNLLENIKSKEESIEYLHRLNENYLLRIRESEELLKKMKQDANYIKNEFIYKRNSSNQVESVIQFFSTPYDITSNSRIEANTVLSDSLTTEKGRKSSDLLYASNLQHSEIYERRNSKLKFFMKESSNIETPRRDEIKIEEENESSYFDTSRKISINEHINSSTNMVGEREGRESKGKRISFDLGRKLLKENSYRVQNTLDVLLSAERETVTFMDNNILIERENNKMEMKTKNENKEKDLIKPFSLSTEFTEKISKFLSNKYKRNPLKTPFKLKRRFKGKRSTRQHQLSYYKRKIKQIILINKLQKNLIMSFKNNQKRNEFLTPRIPRGGYSDEYFMEKNDKREKLFYKTFSNHHNLSNNPFKTTINFDVVSQNALHKIHTISSTFERLSENNLVNFFEANKTVLENRMNKKNQHLNKLSKFQQHFIRTTIQESFTIICQRKVDNNYKINHTNNIYFSPITKSNTSNMSKTKVSYFEEELFFECFSFSLEKSFKSHKDISPNHKKINSLGQFKIGGKNLDVNVNISVELKEKPLENSLCIPVPSSTRTVETLGGSTKVNNNTFQNFENHNNLITNRENRPKENKEQLKEFYKKYLKYSDCFMKDSLKRMLPCVSGMESGIMIKKKEKPRLWNEAFKLKNVDNILFLRKNNMKLKKY